MATAQRAGGLYYVRGIAVDAEGRAIEDAPPMPEDTASQDVASIASPEERIAIALAKALTGGVPAQQVVPVQQVAVADADAGGRTPPPSIPGAGTTTLNTTGQPGAGTFVPPKTEDK